METTSAIEDIAQEVTAILPVPLLEAFVLSVLLIIWRMGKLIGYDVAMRTTPLAEQVVTQLVLADSRYQDIDQDSLLSLFSLAVATLAALGYLECDENNTALIHPTQKLVNLLVDKMPA